MLLEEYSKEFEAGKLGAEFKIPQTKEDYLERMKFLYGMYAYGISGSGHSNYFSCGNSNRSLKELRDHARGVQDTSQYMDQVNPLNKKSNRRPLNISSDILRIIPKFRNIIKDKFKSIMLSPHTEATNEEARLERLIRKNKMVLSRQPATQAFVEQTSFTMEQGPDEAGIQDEADVDFLYNMGGMRLAVEIALKDAIDVTLDRSGWDVIWDLVIEDIIDLNGMAVDQVSHNGREVIKYVDIGKIIAAPSIYPDFRDSDHRGYIEYKRLSEITKEADLTPVELQKLQKLYKRGVDQLTSSGYEGSNYGTREDYSARTGNGISNREFGRPVVKMYFIVENIERYIVGRHSNGSSQFERVGPDFVLTERMVKKGKSIDEYPVQYLHTCNWVVGSDIIYGERVVDTIVRDGQEGSTQIVWPMTLCIGHEPSVIERCLSFDHDIQIANFKQRAMIAKLPPGPRLIMYMSRMKDTVQIGQDSYTILDMVEKFRSEGIMVVDDTVPFSVQGNTQADTRPPMDVMQSSGIENDMMLLEQRIASSVDRIRQVTGVNEITEGSSSQGDILKHVAESAQSATNSALRPHVDLMIQGYGYMIKHIGLKFKLMVMDGTIDMGRIPIGNTMSRAVVIDKELSKYDWGITVEVGSREAHQMLLQYLFSKQEVIPPESFFAVQNAVMAGDIKLAQYLLAKFVHKANELNHQRQMEIAKATSMGNAEAAKAGEEAKVQTIQAETEAHKIKAGFDSELKKEELQKQHSLKLQEIELSKLREKETAVAAASANNRNRLEQ